MMPLPHRLPRSEIGWHVPPWATRAEPPRDAFQHQTMVTESVAPLTLIRGHHRFDSRPELIRNHTCTNHPISIRHNTTHIKQTRPRRLGAPVRSSFTGCPVVAIVGSALGSGVCVMLRMMPPHTHPG